MEDDIKTKEQLVIELTELHSQNAVLEKTRKELAVIKIAADEVSEYSESIINTVREPLISLDQDLRVVSASRSFYEFFKVNPEETVGQLIYDLGNKQWDIPKLRELLETILPQKASFDNYEVEHDFTSIGKRIMLLNARQIQRGSEKKRIILLAIEDITERKEIEDGLEKTRKELVVIKKSADDALEYAESIINTVREPIIVLDQDLRVVTASRSFYEFFKVSPEETMGQLIYDLGNKQWDIPKLRELLETILPQETTFDDYEVEHDFADIGRRVMLLNARQIQQMLGKERIILLAIEDITERKRRENILTESEDLFRGVFRTASDGILLLEKREGKITHINPAAEKMLGYTKKECIGNKLHDVGFVFDMDDFQTTIQKLNENGIINYTDVPVTTKSGQHMDTDIYLVDKTTLVQCNIRDIADRKLAEEELERTMEKLKKSLIGTIQAMSLMVETRDPYTAGHQRRVSNLARTIAQEMGLSNDTVDTIRIAGTIHDIGKISIPADILSKPGKLKDTELNLIKDHSQTGYDILKDVELPYPIAEVAYQHHERLDGSGYPQGLKGEQILLEARIISVADVVEAMSSHRPYRPGLGIDVALEEIEKNKGILYDEQVVDMCIKLFREKGFEFELTVS